MDAMHIRFIFWKVADALLSSASASGSGTPSFSSFLGSKSSISFGGFSGGSVGACHFFLSASKSTHIKGAPGMINPKSSFGGMQSRPSTQKPHPSGMLILKQALHVSPNCLSPPSEPVRGDAYDSFNTDNNVTMATKMNVFMVV